MKQIFTLFALAALCLHSKKTFAQLNEGFNDGPDALTANCWTLTDVMFANTSNNPTYVIEGSGSVYSEPPVSSTDIRVIKTPFLNVATTPLTINLSYKITNKISGNATRTIEVGIENSLGSFTSLSVTNLDKNSTWGSEQPIAVSAPVTTGFYKVVIRIGGSGGDGNSRIVLDKLQANASYQYPGGCAPEHGLLPLTLISYSGNINGDKVNLAWTVGDNEEARQFEIERSYDGKNFTSAGVVLSTDKSGEEKYAFSEVVSASKLSYRLKMIDRDGKVDYSKIISLNTLSTSSANKSLSLLNNPVVNNVVLSYTSYKSSPISIQVYNEAGALVYNRKQQSNVGINQFIIDGAQLKKGTYFIQVANDLAERATVKAIKL